MTRTHAPGFARDLRGDHRGAVLLISVFMASFLVGALWYIIGIGDAAIYRQYVQDGADAIAFGSSVYHARGMNIIALINLVMAAVLAVLVAFKIGQLILLAATAIACSNPFTAALCPPLLSTHVPYNNFLTKVEKVVDTVLKVLYQTSNAVAVGMPWVAEGKAIVVGQQYKPTVDGGFMVSISLIPGQVENAVGGLVAKNKNATGGGAPGSGGAAPAGTGSVDTKKSKDGMRWGLPVQDDEFKNLCGKAGEMVGEIIFKPFGIIPGLGGVAGAVGKFAGGIGRGLAKTFPGYFCGDMADAGKSISDKFKKDALGSADAKAKEICEKQKKANDDAADKAKKDKAPAPDPFNMPNCIKAIDNASGALGKPGGPSMGANKTSKKVYDPAVLGDDYFAIWAFDWGNLDDQSDAGKGVNIAAWNKAKAAGPNIFSKIGITKAEFYYEPRSGGPTRWGKNWDESKPFAKSQGGGLADEAMWNMRWRARLRRIRLPIPSVGAILASKVGSKIKVPIIGDMLKYPIGQLGELIDDKVGDVIGAVTGGVIAH